MSRARFIAVTVASAVGLTSLLVLLLRLTGGVYIGTYPTLNAKATATLSALADALHAEENLTKILLLDNSEFKAIHIDPLGEFGRTHNAPQPFKLLTDGLELENAFVATEADLNRRSLSLLITVYMRIAAGLRYESVDPALVSLENSFSERELTLSKLSDQQKDIDNLLEVIRVSLGSDGTQNVDRLKTICRLQGAKAEQVIEQYHREIKVATKALRIVVDDLARGYSKPGRVEGEN
jgi:hypothetical protein